MWLEKKFNSLDEARKIYPQLAPDNQKKSVKIKGDKTYVYYGRISEKHGLSWRINQLLQFMGAALFIPLGCCIKSYRDFLSRKFDEIKNPKEIIDCYILEQFQKNHPKDPEIPHLPIQPENKPEVEKNVIPKPEPKINPAAPDEKKINQDKDEEHKNKAPIQPENRPEIQPIEIIKPIEVQPIEENKPKEEPAINPPVEVKPILEPKPALQQETLDERYQQIYKLMNSTIAAKPEVNEKIEKTVIEFFPSLSDEEFQELVPKFLKDRYQELEDVAKCKAGILRFSQAYHQVRIKTLEVIIDRVVKNPKSVGIQSISQLLYLASYNNMKSFLSEIPLEMINDLVKNYAKSFSEPIVKEHKINSCHLFQFCEKIENAQQKKQLVINEIVQALEPDEILLILDQVKDPIDNYKKIYFTMLSALQNVQDPAVQIKLNNLFQDVKDQYQKKQINFQKYEKILNEIFAQAVSFDQLYYLIKYCSENNIVIGKEVFKVIYEKNWINAFIKKNDFALIKECLKPCLDEQIYLALKEELGKEIKYGQFYADLDEPLQERMDIVTVMGFICPLGIDLNTRIINHNDHPINVTIYKVISEDGKRVFELKTEDYVKLGEISFERKPDHLFITDFKLEAFLKMDGKEAYNNVAQALHEIAVRQSFEMGLYGHVAIDATKDLELSHFLSGYHYQDNLAFTCPQMADKLKDLITDYFEAFKGNQPTEEILKQIEQLEKNLRANDQKNESEMHLSMSFKVIRAKAKKVLKAEPANMKEVLVYGVYFDKNNYMKKVLTNYPLHHKKLGPLLVELEHAVDHFDDTEQILKKIEAIKNEGDEQIQKIFEKGEKLAQDEDNPDLEAIAYHLAQYKPKSFEGRMYLPDESIKNWIKIIKQKK